MPCDKHQEHLDAFANGSLNQRQQIKLKVLLSEQNCQQCLEEFEQIEQLNRMANEWTNEQVPEWSRAQHIVQQADSKWNWLNVSSFACSALALLLVLFRFEIHSTDSGILLSFAGQAQSQIINQQVHQKFSELQRQQVSYIDTKLENFSNQQNDRNLKLINTVVELNRTERRQDLGKLVNYWQLNQQDVRLQTKLDDALQYRPITDNQLNELTNKDLQQEQ